MGYSCTAAADDRLKAIMAHNNDESSNCWVNDKGERLMYEIGRENSDGAITATVMKFIVGGQYDGCVKRAGSIRIGPNGECTRFPNMNAAMRKASKAPLPKRAPLFQVI